MQMLACHSRVCRSPAEEALREEAQPGSETVSFRKRKGEDLAANSPDENKRKKKWSCVGCRPRISEVRDTTTATATAAAHQQQQQQQQQHQQQRQGQQQRQEWEALRDLPSNVIAQSSGLSSSPASALFMQQQHTCNHEWQPYYQRFLADCQNRQLERSCSTHRRTSWRPHIFENNTSPSESKTIYRLKKESGVQSISYNNHSHTSQKQSFAHMGRNVTDHMWQPDRAWVAHLPVGSGIGRQRQA